MTNQVFSTRMERMLGVLGLFLILVVARLAEPGFSEHRTAAGKLIAFLSRRAIDGVAIMGWLVDRLLPLPDARGATPRAASAAAGSCGATSDWM